MVNFPVFLTSLVATFASTSRTFAVTDFFEFTTRRQCVGDGPFAHGFDCDLF